MPSRVTSQLARPYWVSKIHCHTTVAVSAGVAQARMRPRLVSSRMRGPSRSSSSATSIPSTMVSTTFTAQKASVRRRTTQK